MENERSGLNLSSLISVAISYCPVDQTRAIVTSGCSSVFNVPALSNTTATFSTAPFTAYVVRVVAQGSQSEEVTVISPEAGGFFLNA